MEALFHTAVMLLAFHVTSGSLLSRSVTTSYAGFKVVKLQSDEPMGLIATLNTLQKQYQVDVWSRLHRSADVMVAPEHLSLVRETSAVHGVDSSVVIDDVQRHLDAEYVLRHRRRLRRAASGNVTNSYLSYPEMENYLYNVIAAAYSNVAGVTVKPIGKTFEGRSIHVVELRKKGSVAAKPAILIDAGIHAREWIAPAMALNIIHKLTFNPENDPEVTDLLAKFDWFIVPSVNPDGYVYSQLSSNTRLWRKTRTTKYYNSAYWSCRGIGVDANRNFGYDWNPSIGGSTCATSDVFAGPAPFSEPETQNIRDWLLSHAGLAKAYITIHSFGQYVLYPYGSNANKVLADQEVNIDVANAFKARLAQLGVNYVVGNSARVLYEAAGGSDDYAKGVANVTVSYTLELPPAYLNPGFLLPESGIPAVVSNTWAGLKALAQRLHARLETVTPAGLPPSLSPTSSSYSPGSLCQQPSNSQLSLGVLNPTQNRDPNWAWVQQYLAYYCSYPGYPPSNNVLGL